MVFPTTHRLYLATESTFYPFSLSMWWFIRWQLNVVVNNFTDISSVPRGRAPFNIRWIRHETEYNRRIVLNPLSICLLFLKWHRRNAHSAEYQTERAYGYCGVMLEWIPTIFGNRPFWQSLSYFIVNKLLNFYEKKQILLKSISIRSTLN